MSAHLSTNVYSMCHMAHNLTSKNYVVVKYSLDYALPSPSNWLILYCLANPTTVLTPCTIPISETFQNSGQIWLLKSWRSMLKSMLFSQIIILKHAGCTHFPMPAAFLPFPLRSCGCWTKFWDERCIKELGRFQLQESGFMMFCRPKYGKLRARIVRVQEQHI